MKQGKHYQRMEETRAQVLRYAVVLFLEQGYRETTLDQIARRIDRTKGAVLRAYPDKEAIVAALYTAVDTYHANVINMSWTLTNESEALHEAILHAHDRGVILVACTGNLSVSTGLGTVAYPAAWDESHRRCRRESGWGGRAADQPVVSLRRAVDFCARSDCGDDKGSSYSAACVSGLIAADLQSGVEPSRISEHLAAMAKDMGAL